MKNLRIDFGGTSMIAYATLFDTKGLRDLASFDTSSAIGCLSERLKPISISHSFIGKGLQSDSINLFRAYLDGDLIHEDSSFEPDESYLGQYNGRIEQALFQNYSDAEFALVEVLEDLEWSMWCAHLEVETDFKWCDIQIIDYCLDGSECALGEFLFDRYSNVWEKRGWSNNGLAGSEPHMIVYQGQMIPLEHVRHDGLTSQFAFFEKGINSDGEEYWFRSPDLKIALEPHISQ
jgi:hypothetical protein